MMARTKTPHSANIREPGPTTILAERSSFRFKEEMTQIFSPLLLKLSRMSLKIQLQRTSSIKAMPQMLFPLILLKLLRSKASNQILFPLILLKLSRRSIQLLRRIYLDVHISGLPSSNNNQLVLLENQSGEADLKFLIQDKVLDLSKFAYSDRSTAIPIEDSSLPTHAYSLAANVSGILNPTGVSSNVLPYLQQIQGFILQENLSGDLNPTVESSNVLPNVTLPEHEVNVSRFQGLVNTAGCADNAPSSCNNLLADTIWPSNVPFLPSSSITPQNAIAAIPPIQNFDRPRPNIFRYGSSSSSSQLVNIDRPRPNIFRYGSSSSSSRLGSEQENTLVMPEPISLNEQNADDVQIFDFRLCVRRGLEGSELHDELLTAFMSQISDIAGCSYLEEHTTRDILGMLRGCRARPAADEPPRQRRRLVGPAASPEDLAPAAAPEDLAPVAGAAEGAGDGQQPGGPPVVFDEPPRQRRSLVGPAALPEDLVPAALPEDLAPAAAPEDLAPVAGAAEGAGDGQQPGGPPVVFEDPDDLRPVARFRSIYDILEDAAHN